MTLPTNPIPPSPVQRQLINPHVLRPLSKRWNTPRFAGGKYYFAVLAGSGGAYRARAVFRRATEAEGYATRLLLRWMRLYDAAIAQMVTNTTSQPEQA